MVTVLSKKDTNWCESIVQKANFRIHYYYKDLHSVSIVSTGSEKFTRLVRDGKFRGKKQ